MSDYKVIASEPGSNRPVIISREVTNQFGTATLYWITGLWFTFTKPNPSGRVLSDLQVSPNQEPLLSIDPHIGIGTPAFWELVDKAFAQVEDYKRAGGKQLKHFYIPG